MRTALIVLGFVGALVLVTGVTMLTVVGGWSTPEADEAVAVPVRSEPAELAPWVRFEEEDDTMVRELKLLGLHCVVVEELPLFRDFGMFSAEGDEFVRGNVLGDASRLLSQLPPDATRDERGRLVWGADWPVSSPNADECQTMLDFESTQ